ncbi:hypothetical protein [Ferrimicrobium acidiphilum]|jgi:hypothetical protein|nr:hypothetical protein [Ferrimicrobium acidiphilum]MCL5054138.1 hypothetical protein [Gammaproteobacteria bacterium]
MVAENGQESGDAFSATSDGLVDSSDLFKLAAEAQALETVGLERVLELFQDRVHTVSKRKQRTDYFDVGSERFTLERDRDGRVQASRVDHVVGGVRIRSENLKLSDWIATALVRFQAEAGQSAMARSALERLLGLS